MADTREQILEAAWELFADKGFEDVSVRDVTNAAGVNLASVSYHFGGKDGLIQETVKRCLNPLYDYGIKLLDEAIVEYGGMEKIPLRHLMACWLRPLFMPEECGVRSDLILRLIARYLIEHSYTVPLVTKGLLSEVYRVYIQAFKIHFPDLTDGQIVQQIVFAEGAAFYCSGVGQIVINLLKGSPVDIENVDRERLMEESIDFALYGFGGKPEPAA
ncbi:TetR/AcrR family transcriptional regulator [Verrucomicrobiaceae bacterium N1E253]|uniref:TetR/AcrR family transcriptional regulator n=1 Tax=Oceaniferula marina TaxID=2748318 RepID=A0A851GGX3_9BACT|nr:TetR family transcriptional regulator [Oceaniferula marina]NWK56616.1 TetR/AcrR family transcriptional regulator [Oceaniferula marina]